MQMLSRAGIISSKSHYMLRFLNCASNDPAPSEAALSPYSDAPASAHHSSHASVL